jgi:hypothetical protein
VSVFEDAHEYLNNSIRVYTNATSTIDKLFAVKLVILSMIVAADALIENIGRGSDTPFQGYLEDSNFFLPIAAYEQRIEEIQILEGKNEWNNDPSWAVRLQNSIDILKFVYGKQGFRMLLSLNLKEFINNALFFIIEIQKIVEGID